MLDASQNELALPPHHGGKRIFSVRSARFGERDTATYQLKIGCLGITMVHAANLTSQTGFRTSQLRRSHNGTSLLTFSSIELRPTFPSSSLFSFCYFQALFVYLSTDDRSHLSLADCAGNEAPAMQFRRTRDELRSFPVVSVQRHAIGATSRCPDNLGNSESA
jgi:hypothetical protein